MEVLVERCMFICRELVIHQKLQPLFILSMVHWLPFCSIILKLGALEIVIHRQFSIFAATAELQGTDIASPFPLYISSSMRFLAACILRSASARDTRAGTLPDKCPWHPRSWKHTGPRWREPVCHACAQAAQTQPCRQAGRCV